MNINQELKYGTAQHRRVKQALLDRRKLSQDKMEEKYEAWERAEEQNQAYIKETDADALRSTKRDEGVPQFTTLVVPFAHAMMLSAHTYWTSVFLSRNPILQYEARHGEPEMSVQAVEALIAYQMHVGGILAPLYVWMYDAGKYGVGILGTYWSEESAISVRYEEVPETYLGIPLVGKTKKQKITSKTPGYMGNRAFNVRPQDFFPDPRVPLSDIQKGEFCGRDVSMGWNDIVKGERDKRYYNLKDAKKFAKWANEKRGSSQEVLPQDDLGSTDYMTTMKDVGFMNLMEMDVELIPRDWELGSSDQPEMWRFMLASEEVIIESRPMGTLHGKFPFHVLPYEIEGHVRVPRGMLEILEPLNDALTWLFNSHMFNVRSSLNNQFVADPSRIVMKDLTSNQDGKIIRLKESAYGTDVRTAITQMTVADVTQGHLRDMQAIGDIMQRVSGVTDNLMGMVNPGGRKTATEVRSSNTSGISRLKTTAEYWSAGSFGMMSQVLLQNTQQYYDAERTFKIAGDLVNGPQTMQVSPEDIQGFYDFVPVDGTMPVDRYAQANLWREILAGLQKMPQIMQNYNMGGIFEWMAQLAGLKNIKQFRVEVQPQAAVDQGVERGNLVPLNQAQRDLTRVPEPGQVSGLGTTG